jgi:hypothetical protein
MKACPEALLPFLEWGEHEGLLGVPSSGGDNLVTSAARGGSREAVEWLRERGWPWEKVKGVIGAAAGGHMEILTWAEKNSLLPTPREILLSRFPGSRSEIYDAGDLDILRWMRGIGFPVSLRDGAEPVAAKGHLHVLKWLWEEEERRMREELEMEEEEEGRASVLDAEWDPEWFKRKEGKGEEAEVDEREEKEDEAKGKGELEDDDEWWEREVVNGKREEADEREDRDQGGEEKKKDLWEELVRGEENRDQGGEEKKKKEGGEEKKKKDLWEELVRGEGDRDQGGEEKAKKDPREELVRGESTADKWWEDEDEDASAARFHRSSTEPTSRSNMKAKEVEEEEDREDEKKQEEEKKDEREKGDSDAEWEEWYKSERKEKREEEEEDDWEDWDGGGANYLGDLGLRYGATGIFTSLVCGAASEGHVEILRWAWETFPGPPKLPIEFILESVAEFGNPEAGECPEVYEFLISKTKPPVSPTMLDCFAETGKFSVLRWIAENGYEPEVRGSGVCTHVAWWRDLEMLKWLRGRGYPWKSEVYVALMAGGENGGRSAGEGEAWEWEMVEWVYEQGCPWSEGIPAQALRSPASEARILKKMEWIKKKGLKWNLPECFRGALQRGAVRLLEWIMEEREEEGRAEIVEFIKNFGTTHVTLDNYDAIPVFEWLKTHGYEIPEDEFFFACAAQDSVAGLNWGLEQGYEVGPEILDHLIERLAGNVPLHILEWFRERGGGVSLQHFKKLCRESDPNWEG